MECVIEKEPEDLTTSFIDEIEFVGSLQKDASTQTELTIDELANLMTTLKINTDAKKNLEMQLDNFKFSEQSFIDQDDKTKFFTGLSSSKTLFLLHTLVAPYITHHSRSFTFFQQLVLSLMKLRLNLSYLYSSYRFLQLQLQLFTIQ